LLVYHNNHVELLLELGVRIPVRTLQENVGCIQYKSDAYNVGVCPYCIREKFFEGQNLGRLCSFTINRKIFLQILGKHDECICI